MLGAVEVVVPEKHGDAEAEAVLSISNEVTKIKGANTSAGARTNSSWLLQWSTFQMHPSMYMIVYRSWPSLKP